MLHLKYKSDLKLIGQLIVIGGKVTHLKDVYNSQTFIESKSRDIRCKIVKNSKKIVDV